MYHRIQLLLCPIKSLTLPYISNERSALASVVRASSWHKDLLALVWCRDFCMWHADMQSLPAGKHHFLVTIKSALVRLRGTEKWHKRTLPGLFAVPCNFRACTSQQVGHWIDVEFELLFLGLRQLKSFHLTLSIRPGHIVAGETGIWQTDYIINYLFFSYSVMTT